MPGARLSQLQCERGRGQHALQSYFLLGSSSRSESTRVSMSERKKLDIFVVAAWFGLAAGLAEGLSRSVLQSLRVVSWDLLMSAASVKVIWIAPLFYLVLFLLVGAALELASRIGPRL